MIRSWTPSHFLLGSLCFLLAGVCLLAAPQGEEETPAETPAEPSQDQAAGSVIVYVRAEHRDPFRSLLEQRQKDDGPRPPGPAGMLIEEIDLVGILAGPKGAMILIVGSDGLGYSLTEGAELYDGWVLRIDRQLNMVVFRQNANDPTRIKPYRDIERRIDTAS